MPKRFKHAKRFRDNARELFASSRLYRWSAVISALLVIAITVLPIWRLYPQAGELTYIPLHYNIYIGIDRFGPWYQIFFLPVIGGVLFCLNLVFEVLYFRSEHVLSKFFAVSTVFTEALLLVAMILIILLNV